jgi:hypothetical protein
MKKVKLFEQFVNESFKGNVASFYDSNTDKEVRPTEKGWYIGYHTKSGDDGFVKVDREPKDKKDAMNMLKQINPEEIYTIVTNVAEVK